MPRSRSPTFISRTLAFHLGLVVRISRACGLEVGSDDGLDEQARGGQHLGRGGVDAAVQPQHGAEGAERIAGQGLAEGFGQAVGHGGAAGVVVLDDRGRRGGEIADNGQRAVEVQEVVEGQLLAVELLGGDEVGAGGAGVAVEGRLLVGVLAVTQHALALQAQVQRAGERALGRRAGEIVGNDPVVGGRVGEGFAGQLAAQLQAWCSRGRPPGRE